jgi:hypothetical protein
MIGIVRDRRPIALMAQAAEPHDRDDLRGAVTELRDAVGLEDKRSA